MLASIPGIGNTETEFEIERFQQLIPEEMLFDHSEFIHRLTPYCKFDPTNKLGLKFNIHIRKEDLTWLPLFLILKIEE